MGTYRLNPARARSARYVPSPVIALLALGLLAQVAWHAARPDPSAEAVALPPAPSVEVLRASALGDSLVMAKLLMLWLQAHDNQPGLSIPFRRLDYGRVIAWLERILALDPRAQYPLLAASRVYATVSDEPKKRMMLDFVYRKFFEAPDRRWPWLAHAALVAKHGLDDLPLALKYARAITEEATGPEVPAWARDMAVIILADMGEVESAKILIGYLLSSGRVSAPHEERFLLERLEELERAQEEDSGERRPRER